MVPKMFELLEFDCIRVIGKLYVYKSVLAVISTSLISNKRLSRSKNLLSPMDQYILFSHSIFNISQKSGVRLHINYVICLFDLFFLYSANLICRGTNISKYFRESLRDNENWLYFFTHFRNLYREGWKAFTCTMSLHFSTQYGHCLNPWWEKRHKVG